MFLKRLFTLLVLILAFLMPYHAFAEPKLVWDASSGTVDGYRIYYGTGSGNHPNVKDVGNVTEYPFSTLPLEETKTYYFFVRAYNTAGESGNSIEVSWTVPDNTPPISPQGLIFDGTATLKWQANDEPDLAGYRVYYGTMSRVYGLPIPVGNVTSYSIDGIEENQTYYFAVTSVDTSGNESGYSLEFSKTISLTDTSAPAVTITLPTSTDTYETDNSTIEISGNASDNVGLKEVRWANASGGNGIATGTGSWSVSSISLSEGENMITVEAIDTAGNVGSKSLVVIRPKASTPPTISITSPAVGASFSSGENISFAGFASDTEDGDLTDSMVWISDLDGQIGTNGSFNKALSDGTHTITAGVTDSSNKTSSDSITITVAAVDSGGGISLSVVAYKKKGDKYAHLTWSGANSTSVYIYRDGILITTIANNASGDGEYKHGPFGKGKPATYRVCDKGTLTCSNEVTVSW